MTNLPLPPNARLFRILVVDDEKEWVNSMCELLAKQLAHAKLEMRVEVEPALSVDSARAAVVQRHFHVVSTDMRMPAASGALEVETGIGLLREVSRYSCLASKLLVYTGHLSPSDPFALRIANDLPRVDRYQKGSTDRQDPSSAVEELTQLGWAKRVLQYLDCDERDFEVPHRKGRLTSFIGCWLDQAPKHLPPLLARHATELGNCWGQAGDVTRRVDVSLRFIEVTCRLALAQTLLVLNRPLSEHLPRDDSFHGCLTLLSDLLVRNKAALEAWSWGWYLKRALPSLDQARLLRNRDRHSLQPASSLDTWPRLRGPLQAAMDLTAYWSQHPWWADVRPEADGLGGDRLAGNQWPRRRLPLPPGPEMSIQARRGAGVWQSAVRQGQGQGQPPREEWLDWSATLEADVNRRAWWLPIYTRMAERRLELVLLDIDGGGLKSRPLR